jgi:hypothetical protein
VTHSRLADADISETASKGALCSSYESNERAHIRHQPNVDASADDTWQQLSRNIREIHAHNAFRLSFEENHRFAYNIVLAKKGALLYDGVCTLVRENLDRLAQEEVIPAFPASADIDGADPAAQSDERTLLLKALKRVYDDHLGNMCKLRDILKYMVRPPAFLITTTFIILTSVYRIGSIRNKHLFPRSWTKD